MLGKNPLEWEVEVSNLHYVSGAPLMQASVRAKTAPRSNALDTGFGVVEIVAVTGRAKTEVKAEPAVVVASVPPAAGPAAKAQQ
eukprot:5957599-Alexandrium_andersonii.AAC.1